MLNNSPQDVALLSLPTVDLYLDPTSPSFNANSKRGNSLANAISASYSWSAASITAPNDTTKAASDPAWGAAGGGTGPGTVLKFASPDGDLKFTQGFASSSFAFLVPFSIGTGALASPSTFRYLFNIYDTVAAHTSLAFRATTDSSGNKFFNFSPDASINGNNFQFTGVPADNTKHLLLVMLDGPTRVCTIYLDDPSTPLATYTFPSGLAPVATMQFYLGSYIGSSTLGWVGEIGKFIKLSDAASLIPSVRTAIFQQTKALYGITP